ncbi:MAG: Mov34/MPN/PAD-1 family protein [Candidatus Lambdaproteobacteria bacterium]|nr:Mov34/MPN/PAD-1 family protein [Candidatus Lambdaproteobacteria bacterium]
MENDTRSTRVPPELLRKCYEHGRKSYPDEACGVLSGPAEDAAALAEAHPIENVINALHERDPEHYPRTGREGYVLDPRAFLKTEKALEAKGHRIKAIYHTHVDVGAYFSQEDRKQALWNDAPLFPDVFYLVCGVKNGQPDGAVVARYDEQAKTFSEVRLDGEGRPLPQPE